MRVTPRRSSRQALLFPSTTSREDLNGIDAKPDLIEALADLLLEALGEEPENGEGADEPEDYR